MSEKEVEKAWDDFVASIRTLTKAGIIKWREVQDDLRADIALLLAEGETESDEIAFDLRVWNSEEEDLLLGEVTAYDNTGPDVDDLAEFLRTQIPYRDPDSLS